MKIGPNTNRANERMRTTITVVGTGLGATPVVTGGMVPYDLNGETFEVPLYKQALFAVTIGGAGTLVVNGMLVEVD
jgi:hypothetical protein